ncbi:MAG: glycerate kinase [Bdellovibrionales bacterium]|nr:glycerate kinase [Bdellovibrionales bacterium]
MKILVCLDSFKESITAHKAGRIIIESIQNLHPSANITNIPLSDGGEGFLECILSYNKLDQCESTVHGPLNVETSSIYYFDANKGQVFIESANSIGLHLVPMRSRAPLITSSIGLGELITSAISRITVKEILIGLGGSATCDAGIGALAALGVDFLNREGSRVEPWVRNIPNISRIKTDRIPKALLNSKITLACDVTNPICGEMGAARCFAKQKGATPSEVDFLERSLEQFCQVIQDFTDVSISDLPYSGSAGGIAGTFHALLGATLQPGARICSELVGLEESVRSADIVITGEGRLDEQSINGKILSWVGNLCFINRKPCIAIVGQNELSQAKLNSMGITQVISLSEIANSVESSKSNPREFLIEATKMLDF